MAVPAHDERDFEFAKKYDDIKITTSVKGNKINERSFGYPCLYTDNETIINKAKTYNCYTENI